MAIFGGARTIGRRDGGQLDPEIQRQLRQEGFGELPAAFDPAGFRRQVETARGEIAAPSLRALEQRTRQQQVAGRFTNPAVQAAAQQQALEGFGAGRGQILAGAGQAALGRELPVQRFQQEARQMQLGRIQDIQAEEQAQQQARQQQNIEDRMARFQLDLARQRRLEGTMEANRQRAQEFLQRSGQREEERRARFRADTLTGERAIRGGRTTGKLSATASNIIRAFGTRGGRR